MRKIILATFAALAIASANTMAWDYNSSYTVTHNTSSNSGSVTQGSSAVAGSVSGATTTGTGTAATYGISNMNAATTGAVSSGSSLAKVRGTTEVAGHTESGTLVRGAGAAGSIAGGEAEANVWGSADFERGTEQHRCNRYGCGGGYNYQSDMNGSAEILAGSKGKAWSATGSIGSGGGISVNGFEAYGNAKAKADVDRERRGGYSTEADVQTSSGAFTYTLERGNAIGNTRAAGWGFGSAEAYKALGDD